jgi:signal transduction histidine kinase
LPAETWPALTTVLDRPGVSTQITLGDEEYLAHPILLGEADAGDQPIGLVLRSQTASLSFLGNLHKQLALTAVLAAVVAIISSYVIARTVTRPLGTITSTMREMAASGDLSRRIPMPDSRWQDEDARLLATTFNSMTDSIERFQRDATQRERLSSLGRLSTVIAHEIRNPLMIMKTSLRSIRREDARPDQVRAAAEDIDEEVTRLNRIVAQVLDFARPIKFDVAPADLNALARDAVHAAEAAAGADGVRLALDPDLPAVRTDAERLRQALVNIIGNAIQAVADTSGAGGSNVRIRTTRQERSPGAVITISDSGPGISAADLPRVFEPFFTTRRTGTGIGLAISRNIIEGLGGRITVASEHGRGTDVRIELPLDGPSA